MTPVRIPQTRTTERDRESQIGLFRQHLSTSAAALPVTVSVTVTPPALQGGIWTLTSNDIGTLNNDLLFGVSGKTSPDIYLVFLMSSAAPNARFDPSLGFKGMIPRKGDFSHCRDKSASDDDYGHKQFKVVYIHDKTIEVKFGNHTAKHDNTAMFCNAFSLTVINDRNTVTLDPVTQNGDGAAASLLYELRASTKRK